MLEASVFAVRNMIFFFIVSFVKHACSLFLDQNWNCSFLVTANVNNVKKILMPLFILWNVCRCHLNYAHVQNLLCIVKDEALKEDFF